jgi:hypothetical protein
MRFAPCYKNRFQNWNWSLRRRKHAMNDMTVKRNAHGQLLPGARLNPGGRPSATIEALREQLIPYMPESVEALVELMRSPDGHLRLAAIHEYYNRIAGKPPVAVDTTVTKDIGESIGALE